MLPFSVQFQPGSPPYEQVIYAVKKALVTGQLRPGDRFPAVRTLSQELKINPNTAHKVVLALTQEGFLEVRTGVGTVVAAAPKATRAQQRELLGDAVERLVVEARGLGLPVEEVVAAIHKHWNKL
ncbi:MAG: GntR family transcriptional regulator [Chthoniobacteraceae bacterium]